ncbi:hypothetical protein H9P43_006484 [Blastocladiella emersonii ATCC 22665]|nr:hypothetical protein H9P43_006484 [Blastocladiella emersonii ATCC 22665]
MCAFVTHNAILGAIHGTVTNVQPRNDLFFSFAGSGATDNSNFIQAPDRPVAKAAVCNILLLLLEGVKRIMTVDCSVSPVPAEIDRPVVRRRPDSVV